MGHVEYSCYVGNQFRTQSLLPNIPQLFLPIWRYFPCVYPPMWGTEKIAQDSQSHTMRTKSSVGSTTAALRYTPTEYTYFPNEYILLFLTFICE
jgi:hypothetical protein